MEIKEAIQLLKRHNVWRRGDDDNAIMTDPTDLGVAIDIVVNHYEEEIDPATELINREFKYVDVVKGNSKEWTYINDSKHYFLNGNLLEIE